MKDITDLESTHILLYAPGRVPFESMSTQRGMEALQAVFKFRDLKLSPSGDQVLLEGGTLQDKEEGGIVIRRLQLGQRKIVVTGRDSTKKVALALDALETVFKETVPDERFTGARPVTHRVETTCVVTLGFHWTEIFNETLKKILEEVLPKAASDEEADVSPIGLTLRFKLAYTVKDQRITQHGIGLVPKEFVIEPQENVPLDERRYWTSSPTDSETHLRLLERIEEALSSNV